MKALSSKEADILVTKWVKLLLSKASDISEVYISETSEANMNGSIFTPPRTGDRKGKQAATASRMLSKAITAVYTIRSSVIICPADMSSVIPLLYTIITSASNLSELPRITVSFKQTAPPLCVQAWLIMGKKWPC
ncbi:hypothetical protein SLA2020_071630 [Shorea laevis]